MWMHACVGYLNGSRLDSYTLHFDNKSSVKCVINHTTFYFFMKIVLKSQLTFLGIAAFPISVFFTLLMYSYNQIHLYIYSAFVVFFLSHFAYLYCKKK